MKVFKFGGASVSTAERIKGVGEILKKEENRQLIVVISALGKTTNALEKVVETFYAGNNETALQLFDAIKQQHLNLSAELNIEVLQLNDFFTEAEWLLHDKPVRSFDYYYDQIVCVGELLSTAIVSAYLNNNNYQNTWIDVRDIIRTDATFRDAVIDWNYTSRKALENLKPVLLKGAVITQGFIGATDENESTTLGREGSDYTAAVFANIFNAESLTIWKDVQGILNADPKQYSAAQWIPELNYKEVIEMAYYGAQVIHPKTIKPLQNSSIPLYVKSFINDVAAGTIIHNKSSLQLPPIIVYKYNQVMLQFTATDFSFVSEGLSGELYALFEQHRLKPNLTQNGAISFLCVADEQEKANEVAHAAGNQFFVQVTRNLTLLTIRHYNPQIVQELTAGKEIILQQQTQETIQVLLKETS